MKKILAFIALSLPVFLTLFAADAVFAQTPVDPPTASLANRLYLRENYDEAALLYEQLISEGYRNGSLFYNLGNSYFRQDDLGRSILNYRRAQRINPRDPHVQANIEFVRSQAIDPSFRNETPLTQVVGLTQNLLNLGELAVASLGLWMVLIMCLIVLLLGTVRVLKRLAITVLTTSLILFALGAASLVDRLYIDNVTPEVVIVAEEVDILGGPGSDYVSQLVLHSGAEARLLEQRGLWAKIDLSGEGLTGWVPNSAIEKVEIGGG